MCSIFPNQMLGDMPRADDFLFIKMLFHTQHISLWTYSMGTSNVSKEYELSLFPSSMLPGWVSPTRQCQEQQIRGGGCGNQEPGSLQPPWQLTHCVTLGTIFNSSWLSCKTVVFNWGKFYPPSKGTVSVVRHVLLSQLEGEVAIGL